MAKAKQVKVVEFEKVSERMPLVENEMVPAQPQAINLAGIKDGFVLQLKALSAVMSTPLTAPQKVELYDTLKDTSDGMKKLTDAAKALVVEEASKAGELVGDKGTKVARIGGFIAEVRYTGGGMDDKKLEALLRAKGIEPKKYMTEEVSYSVSEEKLAKALKAKVLSPEEVESCKKARVPALQPLKKAE